MIESRRMASAAVASAQIPSSSGPRWLSCAFIVSAIERSAAGSPGPRTPAIPHIAGSGLPGFGDELVHPPRDRSGLVLRAHGLRAPVVAAVLPRRLQRRRERLGGPLRVVGRGEPA